MTFKKYKNKVYCNECLDEACGFIYKVFFKKYNMYLFICDECESVWETLDDLMNNEWISLNAFSSKYNINPNWNEFSKITSEWYSEV